VGDIMEKLEMRVPYKLSMVVDIVVKNIKENGIYNELNYEEMAFYLYTKEYEKSVTSDAICYLDDIPDIDDDDNEIYPPFVVNERLEVFLSGENLENVIGSVLHQKIEPSMNELVEAINYYNERDAFIQF
jgi:hypothetical protein